MTGHKGNSEFFFPETLEGNKTHCFLGGQSLSVLLYLPTQKIEKSSEKNSLLEVITYTGCARKIERLPKPTCSIEKSR